MTRIALNLPNQNQPSPELLSCGMPAPQEFQQVQAAGFKTIINLCPHQETPADEPACVQNLGMHYINIPVANANDLTETKARQLGEVVNDTANHPVLIHCMSGNRVGALLALKAFFVDGKAPRDALEAGLAAGLKGLETEVWRLLNLHAAAR